MGTEHAAAHVPQDVHDEWKAEADRMDASMSKYIKMMVSAGRKKFERNVEPDEGRAELRRQRNDLRDALRGARERINNLEQQLSETERTDILEYLEENPGARREDIVQHLLNSTNGRVTRLLTSMEGSEVRVDDEGRFYTGDNAGGIDQ